MKTLNQQEIQFVSGAGDWYEKYEDVKEIIKDSPNTIKEVPDVYDATVTAVTDMICRGTGNC